MCRDVVCGRDFTVILTWEGQVVDSRACLTNNAPHRHGGRTLAPLRNWPFPRHPVIAVAAGGAWSCERPSIGRLAGPCWLGVGRWGSSPGCSTPQKWRLIIVQPPGAGIHDMHSKGPCLTMTGWGSTGHCVLMPGWAGEQDVKRCMSRHHHRCTWGCQLQ